MLLRANKHLQPAGGLTILPETAGCPAAAREQRQDVGGSTLSARPRAAQTGDFPLPMNRSAEHCSARLKEKTEAEQGSALRPRSGAQIVSLGGSWNLSMNRVGRRSAVAGQYLLVFEQHRGGIGFRASGVLQAEGRGCDSLGWSAQRAAPGQWCGKFLRPVRAGRARRPLMTALQALDIGSGSVDLGLRSPTRFSPGCHIPGLQPSEKVSDQNRAEAILRCRHSTENS